MEEEDKNKGEEPAPGDRKRRLVFFNSFEEEREATYNRWRHLSPEERLEEHRILSIYAFSNYEKYTGNRLIFD